MTSKERVETVLRHGIPDRVPFNFWMDRRLLDQYAGKYGEDFRLTRYGADVVETFPALPYPMGQAQYENGSWWYQEPYLKDWSQLNDYPILDASSDAVYLQIRNTVAKHPDKAVFLNIAGPLTLLSGIRLLENVYYDVLDHPAELHALIDRIMAPQIEVVRRACDMGISAVYYQDDIASSRGLILSLDMIEKYVFAPFRQGIAIAKNAGLPLVYHSDGNVGPALEWLCELGFDAVNPLQPEFNDFAAFKSRFHGRLAVYGGIDNTKAVPFGTPDEVRAHVRWVFRLLGEGGGLILSSHDIPLTCPDANIEAMVETIHECRY